MFSDLRRFARTTICAATVVGCSLYGDAAFAQWYRTYDDALRAFNAPDLAAAEAKLKAAKKEAETAGRRPGRSVLRYGALREPFIPDYWLGQVYARLADEARDPATRAKFVQQALDAFAVAASSGQVRDRDPEYEAARAAIEKVRPTRETPPPPDIVVAPPGVDAALAAREEIKRLVDAGERALAARSWDAAIAAFQDAGRKLEAAPSLRTEFGRVTAGLNEASVGREYDRALDLLNGGRYGAAIEAFEQLSRQADLRALSPELRTVVADLSKRLADARLGQSIAVGDSAYRERRWTAARDAYESVQRQAQSADIATPRVRESYAQVPERLKSARLNVAIAEKHFADALAIDPRSQVALAGEYDVGLAAYAGGRWADAVKSFELVTSSAGAYRDAAQRKIAAEMQVEFAAGIAAEASNAAAARGHYERVQALRETITGPLLNSPVVIEAAENASSRMRRISANEALKNARADYENGRWDPARSNVSLVLSIYPGDPAATELLAKLNNRSLEQTILDLSGTATGALTRGDLTAAHDAAVRLSALVPANTIARDVLSAVDARRAQQARRNRWLLLLAGAASMTPLLLVSARRRGRVFAALGRPGRALQLYQRVLSHNPTDRSVLQHASALAARHGLEVPLESYFDQYLQARPSDTAVARTAADYFWARGLRARAVDLYTRIIAAGASLPRDAYDRVAEFYAGGVPVPTLGMLERGLRGAQSPAGLVTIIANDYARGERTDEAALAIYQLACAGNGCDQHVHRICARALLLHGTVAEAVVEAEVSLKLRPDDERALAVLVDAYAAYYERAPADAMARLGELPVPLAVLVTIGECLGDRHPGIRRPLQPLYERRVRDDAGAALPPLVDAIRLFETDLDGARARLDAAHAARGDSILLARALVLVHRRYLDLAQAQGRPFDAGVQARIAELHTEMSAWQAAIAAWQQTVSTPELSRRSMSAIEAILDPLELPEMVRAYFVTAGWNVRASEDQTSGAGLLVTPGSGVNAELAVRFQDTQVFCHSSVVSVDDIVALKREVVERAKGESGIAFLITAFAVRHDVYALIYAFMTESPAVTFIPLDAHAIRDAIVEARTRVHLERTLHQWLGHTDIYETHNPVSNAATFFGRGQFINRLVLKISRGENFGVFGLRKIGKTSLVYRLRDLSRDHLVAYVDLQGVASRKVDEVYVRLIESLARDLRIKYPDVPMQPPATLAAAGSGDVASAFHDDLLAIRRAFEGSGRALPHVLLLLDEIELMIPQGSAAGFDGHQDFFRHVRGLYQQERFIVSAVVGATPAVCRTAAWDGRDNPVFQFYDEVFLASLDQVECNQMVQDLGELMGVRFDADSLGAIYAQTAGHPYVTRQLCSRLVKFFPERPLDVRADMVAVAIDQYLAQSGDYFAGILEGYLNDVSRRIVEAIAMEGDEGASRAHILSRVEQLNVGRHVGDQSLGDLELTGLIRRDRERYTLCIPIFRRWLRRSWLDLE